MNVTHGLSCFNSEDLKIRLFNNYEGHGKIIVTYQVLSGFLNFFNYYYILFTSYVIACVINTDILISFYCIVFKI